MKTPIVVDIETIPAPITQKQLDEVRKGLKLGNIKDPEKIALASAEKEKKALSENKFRIGGCQVISLALCAIHQDVPVGINSVEGLCTDDPQALARFFVDYIDSYGRDYQLVGYNLKGFDLPILCHLLHSTGTSLKHPIGKWDVVDLHDYPLGRDYKLKDIVGRFGIEVSTEGDGSKVEGLWDSGDRDSILKYNMSDVFVTAKLYQALNTIFAL